MVGASLAAGISCALGGVVQSKTLRPASVGIVEHPPVGNIAHPTYAKSGSLLYLGPVHQRSSEQPKRAVALEPVKNTLPPAIVAPSVQPVPWSTNRAVILRPAAKPDPAKVAAEKERLAKNLLQYQQKCLEQGSTRAQYDMGVRYLTGDGVAEDKTKGLDLLKKASMGGETLANRKLTQLGESVPEITPEPKP